MPAQGAKAPVKFAGREKDMAIRMKKEYITVYREIYQKTPKQKRKKSNQSNAHLRKKVERLDIWYASPNAMKTRDEKRAIIADVIAEAKTLKKQDVVNHALGKWVKAIAVCDFEVLTEKGCDVSGFLQYVQKEPKLLRSKFVKLSQKYEWYESAVVTERIAAQCSSDPGQEYQETRELDRHFVLHIGETNAGKTYEAINRLEKAEQGVYLGPLRLLALEIYEKMNEEGTACSLLTGEEQKLVEGARVYACTVEMADLDKDYDIAVIDEAQMLSDPDRGHAWVRALMGLRCREIHVCASPEAEEILCKIIERCGDSFDLVRHHRNTKLQFEEQIFHFPEDVQPGDALITFSKRSVLDLAARLESVGRKVSVIYGSLPPEIRRQQVQLFSTKETEIVVATDAIGMGLNLPIKRVVFMEIEKYDGTAKRMLSGSEIRQIAGRAGRYRIYDTGFVTAASKPALKYIRQMYETDWEQITCARTGIPGVLLQMKQPLNILLTEWYKIKPAYPFEKIDIKDLLKLYAVLDKVKNQIDGFEDKRIVYNMISCQFDSGNSDVLWLWKKYCMTYSADISVKFPSMDMVNGQTELQRLETFYKMLDLYYQFSIRMGKVYDERRLLETKADTEDRIQTILQKRKTNFIRRCNVCGKPMALEEKARMCEACAAYLAELEQK